MIYHNKKLYILVFLYDNIIAKHHDNLFADYFSYNKTLELLIRKYLWSCIASEVKEYIETCAICRWNKASRHKLYDQLTSLSLKIELWSNIIMNFIVWLLSSQDFEDYVFNSILIIIDHFIKLTYYMFTIITIIVFELAKIIIREMICLHNLLNFFIINRDSVFISNFWSGLCY